MRHFDPEKTSEIGGFSMAAGPLTSAAWSANAHKLRARHIDVVQQRASWSVQSLFEGICRNEIDLFNTQLAVFQMQSDVAPANARVSFIVVAK
jgi:hypothetical protein